MGAKQSLYFEQFLKAFFVQEKRPSFKLTVSLGT